MTPSQTRRSGDSPVSIAAIIALGAAAVASFNIQPIYIGALADDLALTAEQVGLVASMELAGSALAGVAASFWIRRLPWRRMALFALLVMVFGNAASVLVADYATLVVLRFSTGFLGAGTAYALVIAALGDSRRVDVNFSLAIIAQVGIGILGFLLLPGWITRGGADAVFLTLAGLAVLTLPCLAFLPTGHRTGTRELVTGTTAGGAPITASEWPVWVVLASQLVWFIGLGGVWAFLERIGADAGIDIESVGQALAIGMATGLVGAFAAAALADRIGRAIPFTLAMIGQLLALALLADLETIGGLVIAVCLFNSAWNFALPYIFSLASRADVRGTRVVLMSTAQTVGLTLSAGLAGALISDFGLQAVLWQGTAGAIGALALFLLAALGVRRSLGGSVPDA